MRAFFGVCLVFVFLSAIFSPPVAEERAGEGPEIFLGQWSRDPSYERNKKLPDRIHIRKDSDGELLFVIGTTGDTAETALPARALGSVLEAQSEDIFYLSIVLRGRLRIHAFSVSSSSVGESLGSMYFLPANQSPDIDDTDPRNDPWRAELV